MRPPNPDMFPSSVSFADLHIYLNVSSLRWIKWARMHVSTFNRMQPTVDDMKHLTAETRWKVTMNDPAS